MNGMMRLIWTYMFRCRESLSTSTSKMESLLKNFFPPNRLTIFPHEDHLDPFIYITPFLSPERLTVAVRAVLLTLSLVERDETSPAWPSNSDFSGTPSWQDYPSSSDFMPPGLLSKPGIQEFANRFSGVLWNVALACMKTVGHMSVFDEQWTVHRQNAAYEETHSYNVRRQVDGAFAYPSHLFPTMQLLQSCFYSW